MCQRLSLREYTAGWGLTVGGHGSSSPTPWSPYPGPMVRGVEIAGDVADLPQSVVTRQVPTNGVAVRMAVLFLLLGRV